MDPIAILVATLFTLLGLACLVLVAVGLPGTWVLLALAGAIELADVLWLDPGQQTFGGWLLAGALVLALVGEAVEFLAGAAGTKLGGGTRRGMVGAIVGGIVGAIVLTPILPIPLVGTLVGALIGTFLGALVAERSHPDRYVLPPTPAGPGAAREDAAGGGAAGFEPVPPVFDADPSPDRPAGGAPPPERSQPALGADVWAATGATVGRLVGTLGKLAIAAAIWIVLSVAAFWPQPRPEAVAPPEEPAPAVDSAEPAPTDQR